MGDIPNFSELVESKTLDGSKVKLEDVLDKPIIVIGYKITNSKYSHKGTNFCTKIQFYFESDEKKEHHVLFTGSSVIKEQIEEIAEKIETDNLPCLFRTTIKTVGSYNSLT